MEPLNFHHLRYFWTVAREGSVSRAAKKLRLTQPTVSEQLRLLQDALGAQLFRRDGRGLALTETGQLVLRYADEIFALGSQLVGAVEGKPMGRPARLTVGICDVVPKLVAYRILAPALDARVAIGCSEDSPARLFAELAAHALDVVISDAPAHHPEAHSHLLGECGVSVFGTKRMAAEMRVGFPRSLDGAPFLLPTAGTALRAELDEWFGARKIRPNVVGEFQDAALLSVFAEAGAGLFAAPDAIARETGRRNLGRAGPVKPLRARYYAVTMDRRIVNPAVALVTGAARAAVFPKRGRAA
jgi:LysR family transcriptional activator of nhaA